MQSQSDSIQLALEALNQENYPEAIASLSSIDQFTSTEFDRLFIKGDRYFHEEKYTAAVIIFEQLQRVSNSNDNRYFDLQRGLIKAYQQAEQIDKAIALCQELTVSEIEAVRIWGRRFLTTLAPTLVTEFITQSTNNQTLLSTPEDLDTGIKLRSLSEFKSYCQQNLVQELKAFENKRIKTLATIIISQAIILFTNWIISTILPTIYVVIFYAGICLPCWLIFCRACIQVYGLNFKRNVIEQIIQFIDADNRLNYANSLFIEDKRQTTIAFTRSQLFGDAIDEPEWLEQEDCVYGTIGKTSIFFAEILVQNRIPDRDNNLTLEELVNKKNIFHGLFFEAKFAKNFKSRTFILPNNLKNKTPLINNWRGQLVNLEDPNFQHLFRVYADNQVEARYILSTNLMSRLVDFNQRAKRRVYISFIAGYIYIAIPYRRKLFEPKLWQSMLSFAPLKEYFQDLQLMIGIVEELKLNRRIWQ